MVVRVYISGISGNKEVKKRQQRVTMILDSKNIKYNVIDIAEPGNENEKEFMQENSKARDSKYPLPPQIFNEDHYCGDYEDFDMANELDELEKFLKTSISYENSLVVENGISNGSKMEIVKGDSLKEDIVESSEEIVSNVNHNEVEAVSLGNDVQTLCEEIPLDPGDISEDPGLVSGDINEIPNVPDASPNDSHEPEGLDENKNDAEVDNSPRNDSADDE